MEHIESKGREGQRTHTRIVTVREAEKAKQAIDDGEIRFGKLVRYKVQKPHENQVIQCFRCQLFGHTFATCRAAQQKCRKCSKNHRSKNCQETVRKCANCGSSHAASSYDCPMRPVDPRGSRDHQQRLRVSRSYQGYQYPVNYRSKQQIDPEASGWWSCWDSQEIIPRVDSRTEEKPKVVKRWVPKAKHSETTEHPKEKAA